MIIRSVELQCYGPFTNKTIEFRRGLNLVYGPNESGKTTLMESVAAALYGSEKGKSLQSWGLDGDCRVTLLLEGEGSSVRLNRDLADNRISFLRTDDMYRTLFRFEGIPDPESDDEQARQLAEQLQQIFGLPGVDAFRVLLTFRRNRADLPGHGALSRQIQSICCQSDDAVLNKAVAGIEDEYLSLTRCSPWGDDLPQDGPLEETRRHLGELEENWHLRQDALKTLSRLRKDIATLDAEIDDDEVELAKGERFLERFRAERPVEAEESPLARELAEIEAMRDKVTHLVQRREDLIGERDNLELGDNPDHEVPALAEEAEEARRNLHRLQKQTAALRQELIAEAGPSWLFPGGATVGFFVMAGALAYWHRDLGVEALFSAALLSVFGWMVHLWFLGSRKSEIGAKKERMLAVEEEREKAQARLVEIDGRLEQAGLPVSARELQDLREQFDRHREIELELREIGSALNVLEGPAELEERRRDVLGRMTAEGGAAASGQVDDPSGPESVAEAEERLDAFRLQLNQKKTRLSELREQKKDLLEEVRDLGKIEKEGDRLRECEKRIRHRLAVLATARELLRRINGRHEGGEIEELVAVAGRHARHLTDGRYSRIRIDGSGGILLQARGGKWEPLSRFGSATVDAVGIALRMALIDILFRGRSVPLLLDEPLVNLDQKRMDKTLKQLEKMAASHQVILFSHQESLLKKAARAGWNLVTLNGKEDKRTSRDDERRKDDEQQLHLL